MARLTLKAINAALEAAGHPERLVKGAGYFYFVGGTSDEWPRQGVYVYRLGHLTLAEWVREHANLKEMAR